jgi:hypothetical protein
MHCVNKVKCYFNFDINNLKLNKVQTILICEQHNECNNYEQFWPLISAISHLQT